MIGFGLTNKCWPIGLDMGHDSVKALQLAPENGQIKVVAADKIRINSVEEGQQEEWRKSVISATKEIFANNNFRGNAVVSCLPGESLRMTMLRLSEQEEDMVEETVIKEAEQRFNLDSKKDMIDYMAAGKVRHKDSLKQEFILFAASNETISEHIEMLEDMQLRPVAIDTVPCAIFRCFSRMFRRQADSDKTTVFVDIGNRFTTIVFAYGENITFVKQMCVGAEKFHRQIADKLDITLGEAEILRNMLQRQKSSSQNSAVALGGDQAADNQLLTVGSIDASTRHMMEDAVNKVAEDLAREISLCLKYYTVTFRGREVSRAIFTGGGIYEKALLDVLQERLNIKIELGQPLQGLNMTSVDFDSDKRGLLCEWAVAVGLSFKGKLKHLKP